MSLAGVKAMIKNPKVLFPILGARGYLNWMSDKTYIKTLYRLRMGRKLNLENPSTFNEKLQWLKLYDRKPVYTTMVDKYAVKQYIADLVGEEYVIPTLGVWDSFDEIDFDALPNQFVLKCTHDSGGLVICRDKAKLDKDAAKQTLEASLKRNYYWQAREWPYKDVKPRIIAEKYLEDSEDDALTDFKFFCFDGVPKVMYISKDKGKDPRTDFFDMDFNHLPIKARDPNADAPPKKPKGFDEMQRISAFLSQNIPHLRVDFFEVNSKVYLGELTFFHMSGLTEISPPEWNLKMGSWIQLPEKESASDHK